MDARDHELYLMVGEVRSDVRALLELAQSTTRRIDDIEDDVEKLRSFRAFQLGIAAVIGVIISKAGIILNGFFGGS